jgi:peptidoglycan hydrolase FlgJ
VRIVDFSGLQGINSFLEPVQNSAVENKLRNAQNSSVADAAAAKDAKALDGATRELESVFVYMLLKEMRKTVPETKFLHGGKGEEIFRDMLDEEMSRKMSAAPSEGIGIAKMLYEQLSRPAVAKQNAEQAQNVLGAGGTITEDNK